jgi:hypothetical protein
MLAQAQGCTPGGTSQTSGQAWSSTHAENQV